MPPGNSSSSLDIARREPVDPGDPVANLHHGADVDGGHSLLEPLYLLSQYRADLVCANCHSVVFLLRNRSRAPA